VENNNEGHIWLSLPSQRGQREETLSVKHISVSARFTSCTAHGALVYYRMISHMSFTALVIDNVHQK